MAKKRMVSNQIVDSDAFLDMPLSAQALYLHLLVRADDEGFTNGVKKVMRMVGARDDDLKVLIGKNFVIMFESGVLVVKHWLIHNTIRKDRIIETVHIDEKNQLEVKPNNSYTLKSAKHRELSQNDRQLTDTSQPNDRIDKVSLEEVSLDKSSKDIVPYEDIVIAFNDLGFAKVKKLNDARKRKVSKRFKEFGLDNIYKAFEIAKESMFLKGDNKNNWVMTFDWLFQNELNMQKVLEGNYSKKEKPKKVHRTEDFIGEVI